MGGRTNEMKHDSGIRWYSVDDDETIVNFSVGHNNLPAESSSWTGCIPYILFGGKVARAGRICMRMHAVLFNGRNMCTRYWGTQSSLLIEILTQLRARTQTRTHTHTDTHDTCNPVVGLFALETYRTPRLAHEVLHVYALLILQVMSHTSIHKRTHNTYTHHYASGRFPTPAIRLCLCVSFRNASTLVSQNSEHSITAFYRPRQPVHESNARAHSQSTRRRCQYPKPYKRQQQQRQNPNRIRCCGSTSTIATLRCCGRGCRVDRSDSDGITWKTTGTRRCRHGWEPWIRLCRRRHHRSRQVRPRICFETIARMYCTYYIVLHVRVYYRFAVLIYFATKLHCAEIRVRMRAGVWSVYEVCGWCFLFGLRYVVCERTKGTTRLAPEGRARGESSSTHIHDTRTQTWFLIVSHVCYIRHEYWS